MLSETISKVHFRIKEVSRLTGLSESAIRFYEEEFFIEISRSSKRSNRYFSSKDIKKFQWIALAHNVYKLHIIKLALMRYPEKRFLTEELLTNEEQKQLLDYAKTKLGANGRSRSDTPGPTGR